MDIAWVVISLAIGSATVGSTWSQYGTALGVVNVIGGTVACLSLLARRSHPLAVAVVTISITAVSTMAAAATILAVGNIAVSSRPRTYALVATYLLIAVAVNTAVYPAHSGYLAGLPPRLLIALIAIALGLLARAQRQRLESEQRRKVDQARASERTRIAREMHDVLAHRISLLSVHAGALEFHPDAPADEIAAAAGVIRESAHAALGELREVIGLLRDPDPSEGASDAAAPERPQPTLKDLPQLVEESRQAGMNVAFDLRLEEPDAVPDSTARAVYRVVQEGLTNARKHAPASTVEVEVARDAGTDAALTVSVLSRPPVNAAAPGLSLPGAGTGLIGLTERVTLAGGELTHAPTPDGGYELHANLPLPA
jgi:signal transduction histidine kinase